MSDVQDGVLIDSGPDAGAVDDAAVNAPVRNVVSRSIYAGTGSRSRKIFGPVPAAISISGLLDTLAPGRYTIVKVGEGGKVISRHAFVVGDMEPDEPARAPVPSAWNGYPQSAAPMPGYPPFAPPAAPSASDQVMQLMLTMIQQISQTNTQIMMRMMELNASQKPADPNALVGPVQQVLQANADGFKALRDELMNVVKIRQENSDGDSGGLNAGNIMELVSMFQTMRGAGNGIPIPAANGTIPHVAGG